MIETLRATDPRDETTNSHGPRLTIERLVEDLGTTFLSPLADVPDTARDVSGVMIYDPRDPQIVPDGTVVLGVGFGAAEELRGVIDELATHRVSAIVVREPAVIDEVTAAVARRHRVALLGLTRGASWTQLSTMIYALLSDPGAAYSEETIGGIPSGDLFALTNAIASLLDAPVTIEDRNCRVLAFSARQEEADGPRVETILARRVPERYTKQYTESGFFKELYSSESPVHMELSRSGEGFKDRAAIAVRAGGEILGSIWAAVSGPLEPERQDAFRDAAKVAALHIMRFRAGADVDRRVRADLLSTALKGGAGAETALQRLGINDTPLAVFAASLPGLADIKLEGAVERQALRQRVVDAMAVHLAAVHPEACVALLGDTIYGVLPVQSVETGESQAHRLAHDLLTRLGHHAPMVIGIGQIVSGTQSLVTGRHGAQRALRVQIEKGESANVALFSEVHIEALILEMRDKFAAGNEHATGPVARLWAHDQAHGTDFIHTLRVWLDCLGDISTAADTLHVHPNTLRYRLRRLAELADMDLSDSETRFAAQLLLRIVPGLSARATNTPEVSA